MKQYIKRLFSDSAAFAIATMGNKLVAAILVPVYIAYLQEGELAEWGLTNTITLILQYVCILGTDAAMAFYYYDAKDVRERRIYFTNAILFSTSVCLLLTFVVLLFGKPLSEVIYVSDQDYSLLLPVAFLATLGAVLIQHVLGYARYSRRVWLFNFFSMSYVIGSNLLSIFFVIQYQLGVMGIFYGQLIGQMTVALILLIIFRTELIWIPSKRHLSQLISYGAPLLPTLVAFWLMTSISRPILLYLSGPNPVENADIYEACMRMASIIVLITAPFQLAWRPFSMSIKEREDAPQLFGMVGRALLVIGTIAIMLLAFVMEPLFNFYIREERLSSGFLYVWALSLGTLFNVLHNVFGVGLLIKKQTKLISRGFIIASFIYTFGNFILVPPFGIWGAVSMTVVSYLFVIVWVYVYNQKVYPIDFRFKSILLYLTVYIGAMTFISYVQSHQWSMAWSYYLVTLLVTVGSVFVTGLFSVRNFHQMGRELLKLGRKG